MAVAGNTTGAGGAKNIARATRRAKPKRANVYVPPAALAKPVSAPARGPTPAQLKAARAQRAAHVSQGRQVEKAARQQKQAAKQYKAQAPGRYYASLANDKPAIQFSKQAAGAHKLERTTGDKVTLERDGHYYRQQRRRFLPDTKVPVNPITGKQDSKYQTSEKGMKNAGQVAAESEVTHAAGLKVLDQAMRPSHAIAGGTRAAIKGENVIKAGSRGLKLKDRYTGSDVLKAAGVKNKALAGVGGFVFDVGTDPLTYATGGTSSVAREAAASAARQAEKQAVRAGVGEGAAQTAAKEATHAATRAGKTGAQIENDARAAADVARSAAQKAAGQRAAKAAAAKAPAGKGVTVRFAGKRVGGQHGTRATAAVGRTVGRGARAVPGAEKVAAGTRRVVANVAPSVRRAGVREAEHVGGRQGARQARAVQQGLEAKAGHLASRLRSKLHPGDHERLISAIEHDDLSRLVAPGRKAEEKLRQLDPKEHARRSDLAQHAHEVRSKLTGARRVARRAGVGAGEDVGGRTAFLTSVDLKKLRQTIKAEPVVQARRVAQLQRHELRAQGKAQVAQEAAAGRAQREAAVATERGAGQARVAQAQQAGRARVATEKVRGGEAKRVGVQTAQAKGQAAVGRERDIGTIRRARDTAKLRLRDELRKPVAQRKGVAGLQARLDRAQYELAQARKPRAPAAVEPAAPVSAIRPKVARPPRVQAGPAVSARAGKAAEGYESRAAQTQQAQRRLEASKNIPARGVVETHEQYLRRVVDYADKHDLKGVGDRARKLLASKPTNVAKGYFPREFDERILKQLGIAKEDVRAAGARGRPGVARAVPKVTAGYRRTEKRRLDVINAERKKAGDVEFSTDVPLVVLNHMKQVARAASAGEFAKDMAGHGRALPKRKAGETAEDWQRRVHESLGPGEAIYRLGYEGGQFKLHDVTGKLPRQRTEQEIAGASGRERALAARSAGKRSGQHVILHKPTVDSLQAASERIAAANDLLRGLDRLTGVFKRRAVATVAFHIRNAIGDIIQHYTASGTHAWDVPRNIRQGYRAARRASQMTRLAKPGESTRTVTVAGKKIPLDEHVRNAAQDGVIDTGYVGRELKSLGASSRQEAKRVRGQVPKILKKVPGAKTTTEQASRAGKFLEAIATNRENMTRLATYTAGLDRGLTRREAADLANKIHIDYGDVSAVEQQVMRRLFPFYTWTARSLPVVAKSMVKYPGRTLALEKAREETGQAFTGETEQQQRGRMSESVQRQLPVVIRAFGQPRAVSFSAPQTLLNEMPTGLDSKNLGSWLDENRRFWFGAMNPFIRGPGIELPTGTNAVTRREIEKKDRPLVAAPAWTSKLPSALKKTLDVTEGFVDPKTGKKTTGWRGRADWGYDQLLLGWQGQAATLLGAGRNPTVEKGAAAAGLGGLRVDPLGKQATKVAGEQRLYDEKNRVGRRIGILQQQGIKAGENETPEYRRLLDRQSALEKQLAGKQEPVSKFRVPVQRVAIPRVKVPRVKVG